MKATLFDKEPPVDVGARAEFPLLWAAYLNLVGTPVASEIASALNLIDVLRRKPAA